MSSYVPPFRRVQADGVPPDSSSADIPPAVPSSSSSSNRPFNNRGRGRGSRGSNWGFRGGRGSHRGRGRGRGGGGYQGQATQEPPMDEANLYHQRDIGNHFSAGDDQNSSYRHSSTFHDSAAHPGQLSYVLLFHGSNPRWGNDQIVFAKSKLGLLPEYAAKMLEHGPWDVQSGGLENGSLDNTQAADGAAGDENTITETEATISTVDGTSNSKGEQSNDRDGTLQQLDPTQASQETPSASVGERPQDSPVPADAAGDDNISTGNPTPTPSSASRTKYTDIRTMPAEEVYDKEENPVPSFPSIPPIDYVPSAHPLVAVFEERRTPGAYGGPGQGASARFAFAGWYRVARVNLLAPHSAELVRMQQQKWERRNRYGHVLPTRARDAAAWSAAMGLEWAVVKFEKLGEEGEEGAPPAPAIEKLPEPERRREGRGDEAEVSEKLADMGLHPTADDEGTADPVGDGEARKVETSEKSGGSSSGDQTQAAVATQEKEDVPLAT